MDNIFQILQAVPDHRTGNRLIYPLDYILLVAFTAIMSGYHTWSQMELYAAIHKKDLKLLYKRLADRELLSYTPSHDTFGHIFSVLNPETFRKTFSDWLEATFELLGQHICIDGKTMRGIKKLDPDSDSHVVSAYLPSIKATLNEVFISKKSNEINAIKELLTSLDIKAITITIDAIGTQREIVDMITERGGNYVLNVKRNQSGTLLELEEHFAPCYKTAIVLTEETTAGHGRVEKRVMESIAEPLRYSAVECYESLDKWRNLHSIHKLTRIRYDKKRGVESKEVSYFISSLSDPKEVFQMIREHWAVENNLHYALDVFFGEDKSLRRKGNAAQNVNIIYKIALFFLERLRAQKKRSFDAYQKINAIKKPSEIMKTNYTEIS